MHELTNFKKNILANHSSFLGGLLFIYITIKTASMNKSHTFDDFELFTRVSDSFLSIAIDTTGIEIKQDFPAIVVEGNRDNLTKFFTGVLEWDRDVDHMIHSLDQFEIVMDLEQGYISFFMKPNNHA